MWLTGAGGRAGGRASRPAVTALTPAAATEQAGGPQPRPARDGIPMGWALLAALGEPVIWHVIADKPSAAKALGYGASGLMVSGVPEVLGATP